MDKTIKINLGSVLFQIDEEAYKLLRQYLNEIDARLRNVPGGSETIEDIESRIAELFQSQKGNAGVITKENVESVISVIGNPETFEAEDTVYGARHSEPSRKILYRNPDDSIISGVCGGLAVYMNIQSVWIRVLFILFTFLYGIGFFVYLALWIALPSATSETRKKEMYGSSVSPGSPGKKPSTFTSLSQSPSYGQTNVGGAVNEVFMAVGKAFIIIARIILAVLGISLVIGGFVALVSFIVVFVFKYPGYFSTDEFGFNLVYLPDFLNYIVRPTSASWIKVLVPFAIILPLLALIYWGLKMIFWFRVRDGIISLAGLVLWVLSLSLLSIILFSEGISFAETAKITTEEALPYTPKELYIKCDRRVSDLDYDKSVTLEDDYNIFLVDDSRDIYIRSRLGIFSSDDNSVKIKLNKRSAGRSKEDASSNAKQLIYNYRISGDTIFLDEYFTIPESGKWAFDNVGATIYIPEGTIVHLDAASGRMLDQGNGYDSDENEGIISGEKSIMVIKNGRLEEMKP